jgi:hypothetical protein
LPNYKAVIEAGGNATTSFAGTKSDVIGAFGDSFVSYQFPGGDFTTESGRGAISTPTFSDASYPSLTSANNAALRSFYSSARSAVTSMEGMTAIGELRETLQMIKRPASALRKGLDEYLNALKKVRSAPPASRRRALSGTYLEYAFGWLPLINDVEDGLKAYSKLGTQQRTRVRGEGNTSSQNRLVNARRQLIDGNYTYATSNLTDFAESDVFIYGEVIGRFETGANPRSVADSFGFRLDEFAPTAWELLPWSFLVDYFTNIGDIVSAASYLNANLAWCGRTTRQGIRRIETHDVDTPYIKSLLASSYRGSGGRYRYETKHSSVSRASYSPTVPTLEISIPGISSKWTNIAALVAQRKKLVPFY